MNRQKISYLLIRAALFPIGYLPFKVIHRLGATLGNLVYYFHEKFRKRSLSNLSLALDLKLSESQVKKIAKESFQNLAITCLEYEKFYRVKTTKNIITCVNPKKAQELIDQKTGIIFFCGHQANWEVLFLDGIQKMPGIAIGRPIKNPYLYDWIKGIREKFGGTIVQPKDAIKESLRALKKGMFVGIVGDQGMPEHGFFHPFLGQKAWTTPAPALLSHKTNSPIMVATTIRKNGHYYIQYSDPIWPNTARSIETEMPRLMNETLEIYESSIIKCPGQWLWQHNRFKQETPRTVYYKYRHDCILVIFPEKEDLFKQFLPSIFLFKEIYPKAFLTYLVPKKYENLFQIKGVDIVKYSSKQELLLNDYRFKFVYNFSGYPKVKKHYSKLSALDVVCFNDLKKSAMEHLRNDYHYTPYVVIKRAVCRPGTLWEKSEK